MKVNPIMQAVREATPLDVKKQVDLQYKIANRVLELLASKGMTQKEFAKQIGKSETEVSRWLSGTHNLTIATIAKISVALGEDIIQIPTAVKPYVAEEDCVRVVADARSEEGTE